MIKWYIEVMEGGKDSWEVIEDYVKMKESVKRIEREIERHK